MLEKFGYGSSDDVYEKIRLEVRKSSMFRFDWFLKSRTAAELSKRCSTLIICMMKEADVEEQQEQKRSKPAASGAEKARTGAGSRGGRSRKGFFY